MRFEELTERVSEITHMNSRWSKRVAVQFWQTGRYVPPGHGTDALWILRARQVNREFGTFLQDLSQHRYGRTQGVSTRELYPTRQGKASNDGAAYTGLLGYTEISGKDSAGKPRYRMTDLGLAVIQGEHRMPAWFAYIRYSGKKHLVAISRQRISLQSTGGVGHGIKLLKGKNATEFEVVTI